MKTTALSMLQRLSLSLRMLVLEHCLSVTRSEALRLPESHQKRQLSRAQHQQWQKMACLLLQAWQTAERPSQLGVAPPLQHEFHQIKTTLTEVAETTLRMLSAQVAKL